MRSRRLEDEGVAACERDRKHPHRHHRGEVERRDAHAYAERLAHRIRIDAASDLLAEFALEKMRNAARELDDLEAARHFAARIGKHLAMLRGDERGEFIGMLFDEVAELEHHAGAGEGRGRGPFGERIGRSFHGGVDIGRVAHTNFSRELTGRGIEDVAEVAVAMRVNPRASR